MIEENNVPAGQSEPTKLRVSHKNENTYSVYFPFSEVPVEMTHDYFNKNINIDKYIIDFDDDRMPSK